MLRSVMNVAHAVMNATTEPLGAGSECLINAEQTVLRVLQFELDVALPFHFLFNYAHIYKQVTPKQLTVLQSFPSSDNCWKPDSDSCSSCDPMCFFVLGVASSVLTIASFSSATTHCAVRLASDAFFDSAALQFPPFVLAAASLAIAVTLLEDHDDASKRNAKWWYACDTR
ncbi:hypothetical protein BBJ28_00002170 [Nothophytophthora sp. Chile5]|nr:hypothetical protein BBJ28_00002170 [Nothophytophthora sp. Chile5]